MLLAILLMIGIVVLISATRTRASDSGGPDSGCVSDGDCNGGRCRD